MTHPPLTGATPAAGPHSRTRNTPRGASILSRSYWLLMILLAATAALPLSSHGASLILDFSNHVDADGNSLDPLADTNPGTTDDTGGYPDFNNDGTYTMYFQDVTGDGTIDATLVAEIPSYVQGRIHRCIETMVRRLSAILKLKLDLTGLRAKSDRQEERLDQTALEHEELLERVRKLEDDYDNEVFDAEMGDMKEWLKRRGIQAD